MLLLGLKMRVRMSTRRRPEGDVPVTNWMAFSDWDVPPGPDGPFPSQRGFSRRTHESTQTSLSIHSHDPRPHSAHRDHLSLCDHWSGTGPFQGESPRKFDCAGGHGGWIASDRATVQRSRLLLFAAFRSGERL